MGDHLPSSERELRKATGANRGGLCLPRAQFGANHRTAMNARAILYEQFSELEQQRESSVAGMWTFIASEIMFFGGLFLAFTVYRLNYTQAFNEASQHLNLVLATANTAVLLTSALTMAL